MKRRQPIIVDGRQFKTQKALHDYLREIRDKYPNGATVHPPDDRFMHHAIRRHHDYRDKFGPGISRFVVDDDGRNGRCFSVVTTAGTRIPFSMGACVTGRFKDDDQDSRAAARDTVIEQILAFKDQMLWRAAACANSACLTPLTQKNCHVDHRPPLTFKRLWEIFKQQFPDLDFSSVSAESTRNGERKFRDRMTTDAWWRFHQEHARLRLLCQPCNLSRSVDGSEG